MNKDITIKSNVHRCHTWPLLAEEHDLDEVTEDFNDEIATKIIGYNDKYKQDYFSSIDFVTNYKLPPNISINLKLVPGCKLCHIDQSIFPIKLHYLLLKGLCCIKTIQYYLFSIGILYKSWYFKHHLKHINIIDTNKQPKPNISKSDTEILNGLILQILDEIGTAKDLGNVDARNLYSMREQVLKILNAKNNLKATDVALNNSISFTNILKLYKTGTININSKSSDKVIDSETKSSDKVIDSETKSSKEKEE